MLFQEVKSLINENGSIKGLLANLGQFTKMYQYIFS